MGFAVGKVPRGKDFFPRDDIINKLWNIIEAEHHVLLLAPRRFGKTGVLCCMQDNPKQGWHVETLMLQDADKPSDLVSLILAVLLRDDAFRKKWESVKNIPSKIINFTKLNINKISVFKVGVEFSQTIQDYWEGIGDTIIDLSRESDKKILINMDEFPAMIENMVLSKMDPLEIRKFLEWLRKFRNEQSTIMTIACGSTGLDTVFNQYKFESDLINDYKREPIPPLDNQEAEKFIKERFGGFGVEIYNENEVIKTILEFNQPPIPYFLQLLIFELSIDQEFKGGKQGKEKIDEIYQRSIVQKPKQEFITAFKERIEKRYKDLSNVAYSILKHLTHNESANRLELFEIYKQAIKGGRSELEFDNLMIDLHNDFYISRDESTNSYCIFLSVFKDWWKYWSPRK